jgi:hypothetical protein
VILDDAASLAGSIRATDIDFRSVTPSRTQTWKANLDTALVDRQWWAARAVGTLDYKKRIATKTAEEALDSNEWSAGVRLDGKLPIAHREVRPYLGYFREGEFKSAVEYLTAQMAVTVDGVELMRSARGRTTLHKNPLRYHYKAVGVDAVNIWRLFTGSKVQLDVTKAGLQFGWGWRHNIPAGVRFNGVIPDTTTYIDKGAQKAIDELFQNDPDVFVPGAEFVVIGESRRQRRIQTELNFEPRIVWGAKTWKFATELRWRTYPKVADSADNSMKYSGRVKLAFAMPLFGRLELVPAYERQIAAIRKADASLYTHSKIDLTLKVPFVLRRAAWGWLIR